MKTLLAFFILTTLVVACYPDGDDFEASPIEGRVEIQDPYTQNPTMWADKATVYLTAESDNASDQYYYKVTTDADGNFSFSHRPKNIKRLCIRAEITKDNIKYRSPSINIADLKNKPISLEPAYPKGRIQVTVKNNSEPLNGADVYLFVNKDDAATIKNEAILGNLEKKTTKNQGVAFFYNLEKGTYYIAAKRDKQIFMRGNGISVDNNYLEVQDLTLSVTPPTAVQLQVKIVDAPDGNPLAGIEVYLFTSKNQAEGISTKPINTAIDATIPFKKTDLNGIASFSGLMVGTKYYILMRDMSGVFGSRVAPTPIEATNSVSMPNSVSMR
jgi:hypothetical protein